MIPDRVSRPRPTRPIPDRSPSLHRIDPVCHDYAPPRPGEPTAFHRPSPLLREVIVPVALGLATALAIVAATGNLGAALRALVGL